MLHIYRIVSTDMKKVKASNWRSQETKKLEELQRQYHHHHATHLRDKVALGILNNFKKFCSLR